MRSEYGIFFGDIHNHNAHGYGLGSIERSVEIARTHLDFFAFTGHSSWHDIAPMEGGREQHWLKGFQRLKDTWPRVQRVIADANCNGRFCAFLGFEWHSSAYGDQCVVFPQDYRPLHYAEKVEELRHFCTEERALMIPHHLAYPRGQRGANWDVFSEHCTPVVEIYSEHGNSEMDRGPYPMVTHSFGGRETANTVRAALARGLKFGFVGSSDNHAGFPGAYGEGLMGVLCKELTREALLEAIRARRTYALTGDRIEAEILVEGHPMGSVIQAGRRVELTYDVHGRDEIDVVEVIQDGTIVYRGYPQTRAAPEDVFARPFHVRLEWGWGPWQDLALSRVADWQIEVLVDKGKIRRWFPCLQSGPFDEDRRHRFEQTGCSRLQISSYTSRKGCYRENPNQSVVFEIDGNAETMFDLRLDRPAHVRTVRHAADLLKGSYSIQTGPFPKESLQWHRLTSAGATRLSDRCTVEIPDHPSYIYLRVRQSNGHMAWTSPVFVNYR